MQFEEEENKTTDDTTWYRKSQKIDIDLFIRTDCSKMAGIE